MNRKMKYVLSAIFIGSAASASAAVPSLLNFQGRLLDANKLPRTGTYAMTFKVCDSLAGACNTPCAVGNPCLWTEDQNITVTNGVFAAQLGAVTTLGSDVFSAAARYLDITVAGETLSPRERLASGPFSFKASVADGLANNDGSALLRISSVALAGFYGDNAVRSNLGLGIGSNVQAYSASLAALAGLDGSALTGVKTSSVALAGFYSDNAVRSNLGLAIGSNVQAYSANLTTLAALDGSSLLKISSVALAGFYSDNAVRANLGLAIGSNVQAYSANLTTLAGLDGSTLLKISSVAVNSVYDGALVTGITASKLAGALPAISGASLTGLNAGNISAGTLGAARGGTGADLSGALVGAVPYFSGTGVMSGLAAGSAGQLFRSAGGAAPAWTTATYPAATVINQLLYSNAANAVTGLATAASGVLVTDVSGVPSIGASLPTAVTIGGAYVYRAGGTDVAVADGGTGAATFTTNGVLYGNAAGALQVTAQGPANSVLTANAGAPAFSATPAVTSLTFGAGSALGAYLENQTCNMTIAGTTLPGVGTYSFNVCRYTQIGKTVVLNWFVTTTAHGGTGNFSFAGLPVAALNLANFNQPCTIGVSNASFTGTGMKGYIVPNTTVVTVVNQPASAGAEAAVAMDATVTMRVNCTYLTN